MVAANICVGSVFISMIKMCMCDVRYTVRPKYKGYKFALSSQVVFLNFWLVDDDFTSDDITLGLDNQSI